MTRKALIAKLEAMKTSDVLVRYGDYRNSHPLATSPLEKALIELLGIKSIAARSYATKRGAFHSSPVWLISLYRKLAMLIYHGNDINVRMILASLH